MKKKILLFFSLILLSMLAVFFVFVPGLLSRTFKHTLEKTLPGSSVSFKHFHIGMHSVKINDLSIQHKDFSAKNTDLVVYFDLLPLLSGEIQKIEIKNTSFSGNPLLTYALPVDPKNSEPEKKLSVRLGALKIENISFDIHDKDLILQGIFSTSVDTQSQKLLSMDLNLTSVENRGVVLKNFHIIFGDSAEKNRLSVEELRFQKLSVKNLEGPVFFKENTLLVEPISTTLLEGKLEGRLQIELSQEIKYELSLKLEDLSLPALMREFEWDKKMSLSGKLSGNLIVHGSRAGIDTIEGRLNGVQGGDLIILDSAFLQNIADRMNQPLVLVESGLKEYHYDTGSIHLSKNGRDLGLGVQMDGPKGKRELETVFHDAL